ncbi:hypothetical protein D3C73_1385570 [compost metagenome]
MLAAGQHGQHHSRLRYRLMRRGSHGNPMGEGCLDGRRNGVIANNIVPGFDQVGSHGTTHMAQAKESDESRCRDLDICRGCILCHDRLLQFAWTGLTESPNSRSPSGAK